MVQQIQRALSRGVMLARTVILVALWVFSVVVLHLQAGGAETTRKLGVYSLGRYEDDWKDNVWQSDPDKNPYWRFWEILTMSEITRWHWAPWPPPAGQWLFEHGTPADRLNSARYRNEEIDIRTVIPVGDSRYKCWDDFDLVYFYGHNNTIKPPHPDDSYDWYDGGCGGRSGNMADWGTPILPYCYWAERPITDADAYPAAVTYLYNRYTSCLLGGRYDYGRDTDLYHPYRVRWDDPTIQYGPGGRLGGNELEWLILDGCQAVITADYRGENYVDLALRAFRHTHGRWHIIMGHYRLRSVAQVKELGGFAFDLAFGMSIQRAYFDGDPARSSSAIAAESREPVPSPFPWHTSVIENDKWTEPLPDISFARYFSQRWIVTWDTLLHQQPPGLASLRGQGPGSTNDPLTMGMIPIESAVAQQLLGTNVPKLRSIQTDYAPSGNVPVLRLETVNDGLCQARLTNAIRRHFSPPIRDDQILTMSDLMVGATTNDVCWVNRSSGSYKFTRTRGSMATPSPYTNYHTPVQIALDYIARNQLLTPVPGEEVDLLYVSTVQNVLSDGDAPAQPLELFRSDYFVAFGRRFQGIPIIGSELVLRLDGQGEVVMVKRNWRRIDQVSQEQMPVSTNSLAALIVQDPRFLEAFGTNPVSPSELHIVDMKCGYLEASCSYRQGELRVGGNIRFSLGTNWSEDYPEMTISLEDGRGLEWLWGSAYHPSYLDVKEYRADGSCELILTSSAGRNYTVEASTNLLQWVPCTVLSNVNGSVPLVDPRAGTLHRQRFYRAVEMR